jgi:hypothetical protein
MVQITDNRATNIRACGLARHDDYDQNAVCTSRRYRDCRGLGAFFNPDPRSTGAARPDVALNDDSRRADIDHNHCTRHDRNT